MNSITTNRSESTKSGAFLPPKLTHRIDRRLPGDDRLDVETIIERIREAIRIGRADVAARLAEFGAQIVAGGGAR